MTAFLDCKGSHVSLVSGTLDLRRPLDAAPLDRFNARYAVARASGDRAALLAIGRELYAWLQGDEGWLDKLKQQQPRPFLLEIRGPLQPNAAEWAVLHAPWELLAEPSGDFLAADAELRYAPARRLGSPTKAPELDKFRLGVAFMAAAPRGQQELDFEAEEAAIMAAAGERLDLFVEESGNAEELGRRLADLDPPLPVLHLSCHGDNAWTGKDGKAPPQPALALEDALGGTQMASAGALFDALGGYRPRLLVLSACLTASAGKSQDTALSDSLAARLVRNIPAVLGWDGSVADVAATAFARELYDDLGKRVSVPLAAAAARRALLNGVGAAGGMADAKDITSLQRRLHGETELLRRDWHLARVWLGPEGGGPVVRGSLARSLVPAGAGHKVVLTARGDEKLEVADPAMFVGRRRELQRSLRALAGNDKAGLLLYGMGRLGKSSLAARIIDRRPDLTPAVVFGAYDALSVVDVLARALEEHPPARDLLAERKPLVREDPSKLRPLLVDLLAGPCRSAGVRTPDPAAGGRPGTHPGAGPPDGKRHQVRAAKRPVLEALLHAFSPRRSESRLLLTSRYRFSLVEGGADLADRNLHSLELGEFGERAREKLSLRQVKAAQAAEDGDALSGEALDERLTLLARAQTVARGNPGLQDLLGAEPRVASGGAGVGRQGGTGRNGGVSCGRRSAADRTGAGIPPEPGAGHAGGSRRPERPGAAAGGHGVPSAGAGSRDHGAGRRGGGDSRRLQDLGLLVPSEDLVRPHEVALSVNGLAAGRVKPLNASERAELARLALPVLFPLWGGAEGRLRRPYAG